MGILMGIISGVRNIRAEMNLPPAKALLLVVAPSSEEERGLVDANRHMIGSLGRVSELSLGNPGENREPPRMSATAVVGDMRIFVPLEGIVDPDAEIARLTKELAKASKDLEAVDKKLSNTDFMAKANPEAVQKQKVRQSELSAKLAALGEGLNGRYAESPKGLRSWH
jgi:valyl-tRNA synthetase